MENPNFDVDYWMNRKSTDDEKKPTDPQPTAEGNTEKRDGSIKPGRIDSDEWKKVECIVRRIERAGVDIAPSYDEWLHVGFAFANALREDGRTYYHRVSRFHNDYSVSTTDRQFSACMNTDRGEIGIASFYFYAKQHGIDIGSTLEVDEDGVSFDSADKEVVEDEGPFEDDLLDRKDDFNSSIDVLPNFSFKIRKTLPRFLLPIYKVANSESDCDLQLISAITCISAFITNVSGLYFGKMVSPNIYTFVTAEAGSGKSVMEESRGIVQTIHDDVYKESQRKQEEYKCLKEIYDQAKDKKGLEMPVDPGTKILIIPSDSTSTAFFEKMSNNGDVGLLIETEGDVISENLGKEHGNYSPALRKFFHNETVSYLRRANNEYRELKHPKLSMLISGTPVQVLRLISDTENGLFSRFLFYAIKGSDEFGDPFAQQEPISGTYEEMGRIFYDFYFTLRESGPISFIISQKQGDEFVKHFKRLNRHYLKKYGEGFKASIRRHGLIAFRIAMILSVIRMMDEGKIVNLIRCQDEDMQNALTIIDNLFPYCAMVYSKIYKMRVKGFESKDKKESFYKHLPETFTANEAVEIGEKQGIKKSTVYEMLKKYIYDMVLKKESKGNYVKNVI